MAGNFIAYEEFVTSAKLNKLTDMTFTGIAQNAYQTLQANDVFENKDFLAADEFTDATGTNNTVNTGSSTALYLSSSTEYVLRGLTGNSENGPQDANLSSTTTNHTYTSITTASGKTGIISQVIIRPNLGNTTYKVDIKNGVGTIIATVTTGILTQSVENTVTFTESDYSEIMDDTDTYSIVITRQSGTALIDLGNSASLTGTYFNVASQTMITTTSKSMVFSEFNESSSGTVLSDTSILTLTGSEDYILVYGDTTLPTNTSMNVDVSDGTTTLSSKNLNEVIDISTLTAAAELQLTFNLATTDTSVTPSLKGYGVMVK